MLGLINGIYLRLRTNFVAPETRLEFMMNVTYPMDNALHVHVYVYVHVHVRMDCCMHQ